MSFALAEGNPNTIKSTESIMKPVESMAEAAPAEAAATEETASVEDKTAAGAEGVEESAASKYADGPTAIKAGDYDAAIELYGAVIESLVAKHGEVAKECAQGYYDYANALIYKAEESTDIFGDAVSGAEKQQADEQEGEAEGAEEDLDDLQLAWENLETARGIMEQDKACDKFMLAKVYLRLGDISQLGENFDQSIKDFAKCLEIREEMCEPSDRRLADVHSALATSYGYASQTNPALASNYLEHNRKALECLELCLEQLKADLKGVQAGHEDSEGRTGEALQKEIDDVSGIVPELKETIAAAQEGDTAEGSQAVKEHFDAAQGEQAPVTTTGFGGFAMPSSAANNAPVTTLQPKSKRKATADAAGGSAVKSPKIESSATAALDARMGGASGGSTTVGFGF